MFGPEDEDDYDEFSDEGAEECSECGGFGELQAVNRVKDEMEWTLEYYLQ